MDETGLREALKGLPIPDLRYLPVTGSTNDDAMAWLAEGAPDGALVIADQQTRGRGRLNRSWHTPPGAALAFSLILRPTEEEASHLAQFTALPSLALVDVLGGHYGLPVEIKWPNDVLLRRKKAAGVLNEVSWNEDRLNGLVQGVGINLAPDSVPAGGEQLYSPTCVEAELGRPVDRVDFLARVLAALFAWRVHLGQPRLLEAWNRHLAFCGQAVAVRSPGRPAERGTVLGVEPSGQLRLALENGGEHLVAAGDVTLRPIENSQVGES